MSVLNSVSSISVSDVTIRALSVIVFSLIALFFVSRSKPATLRRQIKVQLDDQPTPLYVEPLAQRRIRVSATLGGGAIVTGVVIAFITSLLFAALFGIITSL